MEVRFTSASVLSNAKAQAGSEDLFTHLQRLIRHPGYLRDEIVSEQLKRYLPRTMALGVSVEETLRRRLSQSGIDAKTLSYLTNNAIIELRMAHERTVG